MLDFQMRAQIECSPLAFDRYEILNVEQRYLILLVTRTLSKYKKYKKSHGDVIKTVSKFTRQLL